MLSQPNGGIDTWQHTLHIISPPKCACAWPPAYPQVIFSFMLVILVTLCCCPRAVQHWQLHWRAGGTLYFHTHYVLLFLALLWVDSLCVTSCLVCEVLYHLILAVWGHCILKLPIRELVDLWICVRHVFLCPCVASFTQPRLWPNPKSHSYHFFPPLPLLGTKSQEFWVEISLFNGRNPREERLRHQKSPIAST